MYPSYCPNCGRGYRDTKNRVYIMTEGRCYICALEDIRDLEIERWEDDGGQSIMFNDSC